MGLQFRLFGLLLVTVSLLSMSLAWLSLIGLTFMAASIWVASYDAIRARRAFNQAMRQMATFPCPECGEKLDLRESPEPFILHMMAAHGRAVQISFNRVDVSRVEGQDHLSNRKRKQPPPEPPQWTEDQLP